MRAKVHKHRLAQRQARQVKGKRENRYVIKVMNEHRETSWLKEVRKVKGRVKGEKMGDKTQGVGRVKNTLVKKL